MQPMIEHQPRIAWDAALALTTAARADEVTFGWCRDRLAALLGVAAASAFEATRRRLTEPAAAPNEALVQSGIWRVRLEDALRTNPAAASQLRDLAVAVARHR